MTYLGKAQQRAAQPRYVNGWTEKFESASGNVAASGTLTLTLPSTSTDGVTHIYEVHVETASPDFYDAEVRVKDILIETEDVNRDFDNPSFEVSYSVSGDQVVVTATNNTGSAVDFIIEVYRSTNGIES